MSRKATLQGCTSTPALCLLGSGAPAPSPLPAEAPETPEAVETCKGWNGQPLVVCLHQMECFIPRRQAKRGSQGAGRRQPAAAGGSSSTSHASTAHPGL